MDDLSVFYLHHETIHFADVAGKGKKQLTFNPHNLQMFYDSYFFLHHGQKTVETNSIRGQMVYFVDVSVYGITFVSQASAKRNWGYGNARRPSVCPLFR